MSRGHLFYYEIRLLLYTRELISLQLLRKTEDTGFKQFVYSAYSRLSSTHNSDFIVPTSSTHPSSTHTILISLFQLLQPIQVPHTQFWLHCSNFFNPSKLHTCTRARTHTHTHTHTILLLVPQLIWPPQFSVTFFPWHVSWAVVRRGQIRCLGTSKWRSANFWCNMATLWGAALAWRNAFPS
jgi:hypothetical protein